MNPPLQRAWLGLVVLLGITLMFVSAQTLSVAGTWTGAIETPAIRLGIVVRLQEGDNGMWNGTIDIPQQGAKGVQLVDVSVPHTPGIRRPSSGRSRHRRIDPGGPRR